MQDEASASAGSCRGLPDFDEIGAERPATCGFFRFCSATELSQRVPASTGHVMAGEEPGLVGETENPLDRCPEAAGTAAGEIRPRRTAVGHEERVVMKAASPTI